MTGWTVAGRVGTLLMVAVPLAAQGRVADRVAAADDGWVTFQVDVRDGVEICDRGIRWYGDDGESRGHWHWGGNDEGRCDEGPLQIEARVRDGRVMEIDDRRAVPRSGATDLGRVDPIEASDYLVGLAYEDADDDAAEQGLFLSRLPRGADPTDGILRVARDRDLSRKVRKSGLFWAGQLATEVVIAPLEAVAREDDADQEVREAAVFALSQHQGEAAVPVLMDLALDAPHPGTRKSALFWLAQRDEPEIADFFADIILGRRGG